MESTFRPGQRPQMLLSLARARADRAGNGFSSLFRFLAALRRCFCSPERARYPWNCASCASARAQKDAVSSWSSRLPCGTCMFLTSLQEDAMFEKWFPLIFILYFVFIYMRTRWLGDVAKKINSNYNALHFFVNKNKSRDYSSVLMINIALNYYEICVICRNLCRDSQEREREREGQTDLSFRKLRSQTQEPYVRACILERKFPTTVNPLSILLPHVRESKVDRPRRHRYRRRRRRRNHEAGSLCALCSLTACAPLPIKFNRDSLRVCLCAFLYKVLFLEKLRAQKIDDRVKSRLRQLVSERGDRSWNFCKRN